MIWIKWILNRKKIRIKMTDLIKNIQEWVSDRKIKTKK